jgi:hypothetical protein
MGTSCSQDSKSKVLQEGEVILIFKEKTSTKGYLENLLLHRIFS